MNERIEADIVVIGAGVIGLACAARLSERFGDRSILLVDANPQFGQETSSRNSEVIHSGIYYPANSLKTAWCIKGRQELYAFCEKFHVPYRKSGKLLVACDANEEDYLEKRSQHCREVGVVHEWLTGDEIRRREPLLKITKGLLFPETGIIDSHALMATFERHFVDRGGLVAYNHSVNSIGPSGDAWCLSVNGPSGAMEIQTQAMVNAAGLAATQLSQMALGRDDYQHRYCRGRYFVLSGRFTGKFSHLVYPMPPKDGLGIHITLDIGDGVRIGPDVDWCETHEYKDRLRYYDCDWRALEGAYLAAVQRFCPTVGTDDISPGLIGIRPKLFKGSVAHPDFLVENRGSFIHCLGIESPGLTASLPIADDVCRRVAEIL